MRITWICACDEIRSVVFEIDASSAPGLQDGFSVMFDQFCLEMIDQDVIEAVQFFFQSSFLSACLNSTFLLFLSK